MDAAEPFARKLAEGEGSLASAAKQRIQDGFALMKMLQATG